MQSTRLLPALLQAQSIYGVGDSFSWLSEQIALGGLLSHSLPEDQFDRQPLWSADRAVCMVADVRLDNRADLTHTLSLPHPEELADSSILLSAWLRWGTACVDHIIGGFAFAVWIPGRQELYAFRDHTGERPLYYHSDDRFFALASMPKGLLALPGVYRGFEETRVADWLACIPTDESKSFFCGIQRLPPGHMLHVTPAGVERRQYWSPANARAIRFKRDEDYAEALLEIFDHATEARLRTAHPIGAFLSAGLDSSSVMASAATLLKGQGKRLAAFTSVPRPEFQNHLGVFANEGPEAAAIAAMYPNVDHVMVDSSGYDLVDNMKKWIHAMDEPALNVANYLWFTAILDRAKQRGISVLLEGAAGNGTFSWETRSILGNLFRRGRWIKLWKDAHSLRNHGDISIRGAARAAFAGLLPIAIKKLLIPSAAYDNMVLPLARPELIRQNRLQEKIFDNCFGDRIDLVAEHLSASLGIDFAPMRAAAQAIAQIELRDPTADKRVFEFCFAIPREQYIVAGHSRSLARRSMRGRLPDVTLARYRRGYQSADWQIAAESAMNSVREEIDGLEKSHSAQSLLDIPRIRQLVAQWDAPGNESVRYSFPWHSRVSLAMSMGYFLREYETAHHPAESSLP